MTSPRQPTWLVCGFLMPPGSREDGEPVPEAARERRSAYLRPPSSPLQRASACALWREMPHAERPKRRLVAILGLLSVQSLLFTTSLTWLAVMVTR